MSLDPLKKFLKIIFTPNTDEAYIKQTQKILPVAVIFLVIAVTFTTTLNFIRGYILMGISTIAIIVAFLICLVLNFFKVNMRIITLIISLILSFIFTLYALTGSNEGFAILWIMLLPALVMGFLDMFWGFLISSYFQILLIVLFWTPLRSHFADFYTQSFISRFPVIYFADFSCSLLLLYERHKLQLQKNEYDHIIESEMNKTRHLLHSILPDKIADSLKDRDSVNRGIIADDYENVSILFADIVNFTEISQHYSAKELVVSLNDLFSRFDIRAKTSGIEKIKTIGDAYMAVCGLPDPCENPAEKLAEFALGMLEDLRAYNESSSIKFEMRVGLNCGPVTAGVLGTTKFVYDVWGDAVNVASRMQSAARPGTIRVSEDFRANILGDGFQLSSPIKEYIKNHGQMTTFELSEAI